MSELFIKTRNRILKNKTYVMGILNITPDSFSDGKDFLKVEKAFKRAKQIEEEGADLIDIGAQSTRPGFEAVDEKTEWNRLEEALDLIIKGLKIPISIDTFYPFVAKKSIKLGIDIINDVSGFKNQEMIDTVKASDVSVIAMHNGALYSTIRFLRKKHEELSKVMEKNRICLDPGVGFGKTNEENLLILKNSSLFSVDDSFVLIGASRKRVTASSFKKETLPKERIFATLGAHAVSAFCGANIIRTHDVRASVELLRMVDLIAQNNPEKI